MGGGEAEADPRRKADDREGTGEKVELLYAVLYPGQQPVKHMGLLVASGAELGACYSHTLM